MKKPVALLVFLLVMQRFTSGADQPLGVPEWLSSFPGATGRPTAGLPGVTYETLAPIATVIDHYQEQLGKANVAFTTTEDDKGKVISAATTSTSCEVHISKTDSGSHVGVLCTSKSDEKQPTSENNREEPCLVRIFGADGGTLAMPAMCAPEIPNGAFREPVELQREGGGLAPDGTVTLVSTQPSVQPAQAFPSQPALQADLTQAKSDLAAIQSEITVAQKIDAQYSGGLVKALSSSRIATLRQTEAALEQKLSSYKAGAPAVRLSPSDSQKLSEIESEISSTRNKIGQQQLEVARYSGGLTYAMSLATLETMRQTLALLELRRISLKYSLPQVSAASVSGKGAPAPGAPPIAATDVARGAGVAGCLKIQTFDSSVLSSNTVYTELAWKIDIANLCATPLTVRAVFKIFDKDDFELDSASQDLAVAGNGIGNARGRMLVSPPEKARRMTKQGANVSVR